MFVIHLEIYISNIYFVCDCEKEREPDIGSLDLVTKLVKHNKIRCKPENLLNIAVKNLQILETKYSTASFYLFHRNLSCLRKNKYRMVCYKSAMVLPLNGILEYDA